MLTFKVLTGIIFIILGSMPIAYPQEEHICDSLRQCIRQSNQDTTRIKLLIALGEEFKNNTPDSALYYYQMAYDAAQHQDSKTTQGKCANTLGTYYLSQSEYSQAQAYFQQALKLYTIANFKQGISDAYNNKAIIFAIQGDYKEALNNFLKALEYQDTVGQKNQVAILQNNIGLLYKSIGENEKALQYFQKALLVHKSEGDITGLAASYNNIGLVYMEQGKYNEAIANYKKMLEIVKEDDKHSRAIGLANLGIASSSLAQYEQAISYYSEGLKLYIEMGEKHGICSVSGNLANLFIQQKKFIRALSYANKTLTIAKEIGALPLQASAYQTLSIVNDSLGRYEKAYHYHKLFKQVNDSIFTEKKSQQLAEIQTKYGAENKEQENNLLLKDNELKRSKIEKETDLRNFFIALSCLIFLLLFFFINRITANRKANILLREKNILIKEQKGQLAQSIKKRKSLNEELNIQYIKLEEKVKERTHELEQKNEELERYNALFAGRENRIKELKDQIGNLR